MDFRETERKHWSPLNTQTIERLQKTAFDPKGTRLLPYVHVLDLAEDGFIKPHIDSSRVSKILITFIQIKHALAEIYQNI